MILARTGATVRTVSSSTGAFEEIDVRHPHIVLCDIEMPGEDGYSFVRRLRRRSGEEGGRIVVVAVTAHTGMQERIRALDAGFDIHIPKPVDPTELQTVIARLLSRGR